MVFQPLYPSQNSDDLDPVFFLLSFFLLLKEPFQLSLTSPDSHPHDTLVTVQGLQQPRENNENKIMIKVEMANDNVPTSVQIK